MRATQSLRFLLAVPEGHMPEIGQTISHYRILEKLGQGGMGVVYKAEDTALGRQVALKALPEEFASDPERMARFEREAKLLASLNHQNIASIHGLEEADGQRFIVMELAEGETLAQRIAKGPLPSRQARFRVSVKRGTSGGPVQRSDKLRSWNIEGHLGINVTAIPRSERK
jgi:hypothetical protein